MRLKEQEKQKLLDELRQFIDDKCIFRADPGHVYVPGQGRGFLQGPAPGQQFRWLFTLRNLTHNSKMMTYAAALIFDQMLENSVDDPMWQLSGMETGSIPIMVGIQQYAGRFGIAVNSFSVRKQRKPCALFHLIDGIPTDAPVTIVDDMFSSGRSAGVALNTIEAEFSIQPANHLYCIVKKKASDNTFHYKGKTIKINSLFTVDQFNTKFDKAKYWLPKDCDTSYNKVPEYR